MKRDSAKRSKLHHAAFDSYFLGIRPDYVIEIRKDVLDEEDGSMLIHGLKDLNSAEGGSASGGNRKIILPSPHNLSGADIIEYFGKERLQLKGAVIEDVMSEIAHAIPIWEVTIQRSFLSENMKEKYYNVLSDRRKVLDL